MVSSINELLNMAEFESFVGRDAELQLMQEQMAVDKRQWNILHFYGISGMGKTALLKRFMKITTTSTVIYLDTDQEIQSSQQFLDKIATQIHRHSKQTKEKSIDIEKPYTIVHIIDYLNASATKESPLILLLDSFERWKPVAKWLFESFISNLSAEVRFISAGRESLEDEWLRSNAWSLLVKNIMLKPLKKRHVQQYLKNVGVVDPVLSDTIVKLSNGIPFAMNLCFKKINGSDQQVEIAEFKQIIRSLCQAILDELNMSMNQRVLLEAASVVG